MNDIREELLTYIYNALVPVGIPIYSVVPDNMEMPYIFIGNISTGQTVNKSEFRVQGFVNIELYYRAESSLVEGLNYLDQTKSLLQPTKDYIPDFLNEWWLESDVGLQMIDPSNKVYIATIQYRFEY